MAKIKVTQIKSLIGRKKNHRLSMMVKIFDKMKSERKILILKAAQKFIKQNTI